MIQMPADLHLHTVASDGTFTPGTVVEIAHRLGITTVSITDHDTVDALEEGSRKAFSLGIEFIHGVELSSVYEETDVHILGYFIDWKNRELKNYLGELKKKRLDRAEKMVELLKDHGFEIAFEEVLKEANNYKGVVGRSHIARTLVKKGLIHSVEEAFERYIGRGGTCYVAHTLQTPFEVIDNVRQFKGIPVLAHPGLLKDETLIYRLRDAGLLGIEVFHPNHTHYDAEIFLELAKELGLLVSGGSDCHGIGSEMGMRIGSVILEDKYLRKLKSVKSLS